MASHPVHFVTLGLFIIDEFQVVDPSGSLIRLQPQVVILVVTSVEDAYHDLVGGWKRTICFRRCSNLVRRLAFTRHLPNVIILC